MDGMKEEIRINEGNKKTGGEGGGEEEKQNDERKYLFLY